jgi:hypothetical protein
LIFSFYGMERKRGDYGVDFVHGISRYASAP